MSQSIVAANNSVNSDAQLRYAPLGSGYTGRYVSGLPNREKYAV